MMSCVRLAAAVGKRVESCQGVAQFTPQRRGHDVVEERVDDRRGEQGQQERQSLPADDRVPDAPVCRRACFCAKI